jgi:hypothetical protein
VANSRVLVERSRVIDAPPERVWSLLSSPLAWSLRIASFAFDICPPSVGRLRLSIGLRGTHPACGLYLVTDEIPGQVISCRSLPSGQEGLTLSAEPHDHGTRVTIAATSLAERRSKPAVTAYWHVRLDDWLGNVDAVFRNSRPWPDGDMDPGLNAVCRPTVPLVAPAEVSASALIDAPAALVWGAVHNPGSQVLFDPEHFVDAGHVPGTPISEVGEMQYSIARDADGRLSPTVIVVSELAGQQSARTVLVAPGRHETLHEVTPTPDGTELRLTHRWPARRKGLEAEKRRQAERLAASLDGYKALIEKAAGGQR